MNVMATKYFPQKMKLDMHISIYIIISHLMNYIM